MMLRELGSGVYKYDSDADILLLEAYFDYFLNTYTHS